VGQAARGILRSSAQATFVMGVMAPNLAGGYMGAPSWVICLGWRNLHLRGACIAMEMQCCLVICFACAPVVVSMPNAPSKVGMVSPFVGAHECCDDTQGDWCVGMA